MTEGKLYLYMGPTAAIIIAATFLIIWLSQRSRRYILFFSAAFFSFALGLFSQLLGIPPGVGRNAVASATLYAFCILYLIEGISLRLNKRRVDYILYLMAAAIVALIYYFYYVYDSLIARIYVQNFGYGLMLLIGMAQIGLGKGLRRIDYAIFWTLLLFALHFFPRTILTVGASDIISQLDGPGRAGMSAAAARAAFGASLFWQILNFSVLVSGLLIAIVLLAAIALDVIDDLRREGGVDTLTGLANRRGFDRKVKELLANHTLHPFSVIYCDIDHFKAINDAWGHHVGDRVLQGIAKILAREVRGNDIAARFGGEEFILLISNANRFGAGRVAERVREEIEGTRFHDLKDGTIVTASFGVAELGADEELLVTIHRADQLVYVAKRAGRNCIRMSEE
ncbi:GGDEF domain-containing protein [Chelatococcus asaccharovorans]|uniref:GGDEF domain-containing protein n=1 Tax=Chelatococcus asaccharovorans TaxID=28210 RepID=UPI00224C69EB|nr:GGDEF domain-containing protein [Chelatococcus asaccharovorans]CAH1660924.1 putative Heme-regulated two-component response regulator [Chelatococcus asaccharovorans]CAH1690153.1 putative Heme-regulated two-component response regulator [Chelatococcus asaccharovorans]